MHWEFENETQFSSTRLDTKNETELIFVRVRGEICIFSFSDDDESLVQVFCELLSKKKNYQQQNWFHSQNRTARNPWKLLNMT